MHGILFLLFLSKLKQFFVFLMSFWVLTAKVGSKVGTKAEVVSRCGTRFSLFRSVSLSNIYSSSNRKRESGKEKKETYK